ncbi:MAG: tetratricopeptide repeat protein [Magnetococcales bacterium]|nr:tetratricopeptide repeat protein [Magnetococcales bacterium]
MDFPYLIGWAALSVTLGAIIFGAGRRLGREEEALRIRRQDDGKEAAFYFRGLNFLLADEPDKAIEEFIKFVRINSETVEIHLSLGKLYRARGEVGRAIRIHQNLIARPNLSVEHRTAALYALAEDYRQGGFVDRAVDAYRQVLNVDPEHRAALAGLQGMHENEGRWDMALDVLKRLEKVTRAPDPRREAHIRVRMGMEIQSRQGSGVVSDEAMDHYQTAIKVFPGCVEAHRLLGEAQLTQGRTRGAIKSFEALKTSRPSHFFMLAEALRRAYERDGDPGGFEKCMNEAVHAFSSSARLVVYRARMLEEQGRLVEATELLRAGMAKHPGSLGIICPLIPLLAKQNLWQEAVATAQRQLDRMLAVQHAFQCARCGFKAQDIYWKCPQCLQWDSMEPL